jgi:uncharacterized membrane protein
VRATAFVVGLLIIAVGAVGVVAPSVLLWIAQHPVSAVELYVIAAGRVALGLLLLAVARASRAPKTLRVMGAIALIAGITTPFLGVARAQAIMDWFSHHGSGFLRFAALVALAIGGFVAYTCAPARRPGRP